MGGQQVLVGNTRMLQEQGVVHDAEASAAFETSWGKRGMFPPALAPFPRI